MTFSLPKQLIGNVLYVIGAITIIYGVALVIPTMTIVAKFDDPILLIGTPMLMNGITLCAIGVLIVSFGKVINLLLDVVEMRGQMDAVFVSTSHNAEKVSQSNASDPSSTLVRCPSCNQQLRVPAGKKGMIKCPKCNWTYETQT